MASSSTVTEALDEMGFGGLWRSCSVGSMEDIQRECFDLTEKLIEVSRAGLSLRETTWQNADELSQLIII